MARILVTQRLVEGGLVPLEMPGHEIVQRDEVRPMDHDELIELAPSFDAIICLLSDRIDHAVLSAGERLSVVGTVSVGVDNVDLVAARALGVSVVNTPGVLDSATAEIAIMLMLAARRRSSDGEADLRAGRWAGWGLGDHLGLDLCGATLGLVGYGRIAKRVESMATGFEMVVVHHTRTDTGLPGWIPSLHELASSVDVLSIHVPLSESTAGLIDRSVIDAMRPTAVLVNTARGPVLDEHALADALEGGRLWGAGLDVYTGEPSIDPRLLAAPHTVLLPHIGSATVDTRRAMCQLASRGVLDVLEGRTPTNLVP